MPKIVRYNGYFDAIELDFVEREATSKKVMKLALQQHLSRRSFSNTVITLDILGIFRARSTVHNWVQKSDLEPEGGRDPGKIALDKTVVKVNGEQYWLYAAVEPETNAIYFMKLYHTRTKVVTEMFLRDLAEKHGVEDTEFLVDGAP